MDQIFLIKIATGAEKDEFSDKFILLYHYMTNQKQYNCGMKTDKPVKNRNGRNTAFVTAVMAAALIMIIFTPANILDILVTVNYFLSLVIFLAVVFTGSKIITAVSSLVSAGGIAGIVVGFAGLMIAYVVMVFATRGSTRITEISSWFAQDATPGAMMAIESIYTSGEISEEVCIAWRSHIKKQIEFLAAMAGIPQPYQPGGTFQHQLQRPQCPGRCPNLRNHRV
jgi:flagellar biosynthesis component FlhA